MQQAKAGDIIGLETGDYGALSLLRLNFDPAITIVGRPDAVIGSINVVQCQGIVFDRLAVRFVPDADTVSHASAVRFFQSQRMTLRYSVLLGGFAVNGVPQSATALDATGNVIGLPAARGVTAQDCQSVTIENNDISIFHTGLSPSNVSGLTITGNTIHDLRTSPITGGGVNDVLIENNHLHSSTPWNFGDDGDHGDWIHLWTVAGQSGPTRNVVIRGNFCDQHGKGALLGIYLDDDGRGIGFTEVDIRNNVVANADRQAIRLEKVKGKVERNTLVTPVEIADKRFLPCIMVTAGSLVEINQNIAGKAPSIESSSGAQWTGTGNIEIDRPGYNGIFYNGLAATTRWDWDTLPGVMAGAAAG